MENLKELRVNLKQYGHIHRKEGRPLDRRAQIVQPMMKINWLSVFDVLVEWDAMALEAEIGKDTVDFAPFRIEQIFPDRTSTLKLRNYIYQLFVCVQSARHAEGI